ncbi:GTP-binding protein RAD, partial [Biomphalaria glabrata]
SRTSSSVSYGSTCEQSPGVPSSPIPTTSPLAAQESPFRVTVLGCPGVGKRSLTQQFTTSHYLGGVDSPFSQEGDRELHVSVLLDGLETALEFSTPIESLALHSVPTPDAFVIVFTIDDRSTFERATDLLYELRKMDCWTGPVILVANKCDLVRTRAISTEEAISVATTYDCKYIETSTVLNHNVDELLVGVVAQIRLKEASTSKSSNSDVSCYARSKHLLSKIFKKDNLSKSCENLYVL